MDAVSCYPEHFDMVRADTPALLDQAYRLRYQVYCVENAFENPAEQIGGRETDGDDDRAVHTLLVHRRSGVVAGTVRVILSEDGARSRPLPIHRVVDAASRDWLDRLPGHRTAEVSRFAVSKDFRQRRDEYRYADIGEGMEASAERRVLPYITFGLLRGVLETCRDLNINHICAVMEPALVRLLARIGLTFEPVGGLVEHHGLRQPCVAHIAELVDSSRSKGSLLWRYASETTRRSTAGAVMPQMAD